MKNLSKKLLSFLFLGAIFITALPQEGHADVPKCSMTIESDKHTSDKPAVPNGVCKERDNVYGFYVSNLDQFVLSGALNGYVGQNGQVFELPMGGQYSHAELTVYIVKKAAPPKEEPKQPSQPTPAPPKEEPKPAPPAPPKEEPKPAPPAPPKEEPKQPSTPTLTSPKEQDKQVTTKTTEQKKQSTNSGTSTTNSTTPSQAPSNNNPVTTTISSTSPNKKEEQKIKEEQSNKEDESKSTNNKELEVDKEVSKETQNNDLANEEKKLGKIDSNETIDRVSQDTELASSTSNGDSKTFIVILSSLIVLLILSFLGWLYKRKVA